MDWGELTVGVPKSRYLKVTNINSTPVNFKQVIKRQLDELVLDLIKVEDGHGEVVPPFWKD